MINRYIYLLVAHSNVSLTEVSEKPYSGGVHDRVIFGDIPL